jgi:hypothetical protein
MGQVTFTATPNTVAPTGIQAAFPSWNTNPQGSEYAAIYNRPETIHIRKAVSKTIIENFPAMFNIFRIVFSKPMKYELNDEYSWTETPWLRPAIYATVGTASNPQTMTLSAGYVSNVAVNDIVTYPDNTKGIVTTVTAASNQIVVANKTGGGNLPLIVSGDRLTMNPIIADGMNTFFHFDRMTTNTYTNYIYRGQRNKRWTRMDIQKYLNVGQTDFFDKDMSQLMRHAQLDVFQQFFNGDKGEFVLPVTSGGTQLYPAKSNWGVFPFMQYNGSQHATSSPTTLEADFVTLAQNTNYKNVDVPRFILGTNKALYAMSKVFKNPIRYAPNDSIANMNLSEYQIGSMKFVPMECPLFEQRSNLFPTSFENMLLVLDLDTIDPVCMLGFEPFMVRNTKSLSKENGGYQDFIDYFIEYMISCKMTNTDSSFYINLNGI